MFIFYLFFIKNFLKTGLENVYFLFILVKIF